MLAEMARAFSLGLGLGGTAPNVTRVGDGAQLGEAAGERNGEELGEGAREALPQEDSIGQFFIDLQADLRAGMAPVRKPLWISL